MANIAGKQGVMNAFSGGADTITFNLNAFTKEFQLVAKGFLLSAATVTVLPVGDSNEPESITMTGMNKTCSISDAVGAIGMRSVTLGGLPAGTYQVGCYQ